MTTTRAERSAARKVRDKWRAKAWYTIVTPESFAFKEIAQTPSELPEQLIGRIAETTLYEITGNVKKSHVKLFFKVEKIDGTKAITKFIGHDTSSDYTRRMVRRRKSRIDVIVPVSTNDGYTIRVKVTAVADKRINSAIQSAIRESFNGYLIDYASKNTFSEFIKYLISDGINIDLEKAAHRVYPIKKLEVRKSNLIRSPSEPLIEAVKKTAG